MESAWHCFADAAFSGKFAFPICEHSARATDRHTLRNFSCMVTTFCVSVAVSNIGAEWRVEGNVICNVLMTCYRSFFICVPNHNRFASKVEGFTFRVSGLRV